ncbi:hypothetical protein [Arthrobacter sp. UYCu712]|uniref:hypothetical protein n=1 Tax=Arthrobacter sp. UYCu712 TaxID=3156340 RepID=UPI003396C19A
MAQLRRLAKELRGGAQRLDQPGRQLSGTIGTSPRKGHDGECSRSGWNAAHLKALKAASAGIETAAKALLLNADEQHSASQSGAGDAGPGLPGAPGNDRAGQELTDRLAGMTRTERAGILSAVRRIQGMDTPGPAHADAAAAAKQVVDQLVDSGVLSGTGSDGVVFTEALTVLGEPSIEGAKSYYEQSPAVTAYIDTGRFPPAGLDGHHGNISVREDRWELIDRDTLGAYEDWLHGEDNPYGEMTKPMAGRVENYRMVPKEIRTPLGAP